MTKGTSGNSTVGGNKAGKSARAQRKEFDAVLDILSKESQYYNTPSNQSMK